MLTMSKSIMVMDVDYE